MSHFLRESLFFWLLAAAVNLSENSWLFIGGRLDGKRVVGSGLCAAGMGDDAHLCHGCWDFLRSFASLNFCLKLCILGLESHYWGDCCVWVGPCPRPGRILIPRWSAM